MSLLRERPGKPSASLAILRRITTGFREEVKSSAESGGIPWVKFKHEERKDDLAQQLRRERGIRNEVVFIGVAQE